MRIGMHVRANKDDWVKAKLRWADEEVKVKLRLKGDSMDHWSTDKWSFKINITLCFFVIFFIFFAIFKSLLVLTFFNLN